MGLFNPNATCGICGNGVGLSRLKIKSSDTRICMKCLTKISKTTTRNIEEIPIEELKEMVDADGSKRAERVNKILNSPLQTAEGMYQYCQKNGYRTGCNEQMGVKHFQLIESNLMDGEEVAMTFIGIHNYKSTMKNMGAYAYAITNKRIMMGQQSLAGPMIQTVMLDNINDITLKSGMVYGIITIDTMKECFNVALDWQSAQKANTKVTEVIYALKGSSQPAIKENNISAADELKKFKELLDMGALTQEEFDAKKKQLLGL